MQNIRKIHALVLLLAVACIACAGGNRVTAVASASDLKVSTDDLGSQSPATTVQSFTTVDGPDLMSKLDAAQTRGHAKSTPYWSAYAFDVRPGIAVDVNVREFNGTMNTVGDTSVLIGTNNGVTLETRNLAVFLLREPSSNQITRMEIYNLERKREYSNYPVYWLGRANNEESLNYLKALSAAAPLDALSERSVLGIALHDDARVGGMLKTFVSSSPNERIRSSAIYWLGYVGGEQQFLATIVRNESEDKKLRRAAAHAIGNGRERGMISLLQTLYGEVKDVEVRRSLISAGGNSVDEQAAWNFLLGIAKNDADAESRRTAVRRLGDFERPEVVEELMKIYTSDSDAEVKRTVLRAMADVKNPKAQARLMDLARSEQNPELRKQAIRVVGDRGEEAVDDLVRLYDAEQVPDVKRAVLQSLADIKSNRVEDKLFAVAQSNEVMDVRRQAIRLLGERVSKKSLDFLSTTAQSATGDTEVQIQAVRAISERRQDEAVPLLIKIARTHANQLVKKQAIRSLGESGDPRAVEFFREVLSK
jgi:HEAT repeat protein